MQASPNNSRSSPNSPSPTNPLSKSQTIRTSNSSSPSLSNSEKATTTRRRSSSTPIRVIAAVTAATANSLPASQKGAEPPKESEPPPEAAEAWYSSLLEALRDPTTGLQTGERKHHLKTHTNCFHGKELVNWLLDSKLENSREEATVLGGRLLREGIIESVSSHKDHFNDSAHLFRFSKEEEEKRKRSLTSGLHKLTHKLKTTTTSAEAKKGGVRDIVHTIFNDEAWEERQYLLAEEEAGKKPEDIIWAKHPTNAQKAKLVYVNVLHQGNVSSDGLRWMIGLDGSLAALEAFDWLMDNVCPEKDHVFLVCVREKPLPDVLALHSERTPERVNFEFLLWKTARKIVKPLHKRLSSAGIEHTILAPRSRDHRKQLVQLSKRFLVDTLVLGHHGEGDHGAVNKATDNWRSTVSYVKKNAKCAVIVRVSSNQKGGAIANRLRSSDGATKRRSTKTTDRASSDGALDATNTKKFTQSM
ncbi:vacuolar membrane-associated protein iml1 [Balamuthia mandrillaris]